MFSPHPRGLYKRQSKCKACKAVYHAARRTALGPVALKAERRRTYLAHRDKRIAETVAYYKANKDRLADRTRAYKGKYRDRNRELLRAKCRAYMKAKRDDPDYAGYHRSYYLANKTAIRARIAKWRELNRERFNAKRREYCKKNPHKVALWTYARRVRWLSAVEAEPVDPMLIAKRDKWRCHICGKRVTKRTFSLDHIDPVAIGGSHTYKNLVTAHRRCNSKRGAGRLPAQRRIC